MSGARGFASGVEVVRRSHGWNPSVVPVEVRFDGETEPTQAVLSALKAMKLSHDTISEAAELFGLGLNPSTLTRIAREPERNSTPRVLAALCYVWAVAYMSLKCDDVVQELVEASAEMAYVQANVGHWRNLLARRGK